MAKGKFIVADKAAELIPEAVVIGSHELHVRRSGNAMEKVMAMETGDEEAPDKEKAAMAVEILYTGLSYLLVDDEDKNPDPNWLKENIDFEVASMLMSELMPGGDEGTPPVPDPVPPSTPGSGENP